MTWLAPLFLIGAGAAALPLVLHLLRRRPRRPIPFPTLRFLGPGALVQSRSHRIRRRLVLALRCLAICLVAAAFARPMWNSNAAGEGSVAVLVLDESLSMRADDRASAQRDRAMNLVRGLKPGSRVGLLASGQTPRWIVPISSDLSAAQTALARHQPGWGRARYNSALRVALAALMAEPARHHELHWFGDHQKVSWLGVDFATPFPDGLQATFPPIPNAPERQAALDAPLLRKTADGWILESWATSWAPHASERRTVHLEINGNLRDSSLVELRPGARVPVRFQLASEDFESGEPIRFRLSLSDPDDLADDDQAWAVWEPRGRPRVAVFPQGDTLHEDFAWHAVQAAAERSDRRFDAFRLNPADTQTARQAWHNADVMLLRGGAPYVGDQGQALTAFLQQDGRAAWLMLDGHPAQIAWLKHHGIQAETRRARFNAPDTLWTLRGWDTDHPGLSEFRDESLMPLLEIAFRQGWNVNSPSLEPLARWPDQHPAIGCLRFGRGCLWITGFSDARADSDWPLRAIFAPMVVRTLDWLVTRSDAPDQTPRVGHLLPLKEPGQWRTIDPAPGTAPTRAGPGTLRLTQPGIFQFTPDNAASPPRLIAVNLDLRESDLAPWPEPAWDQFTQPRPTLARTGAGTPHAPDNLSAATAVAQPWPLSSQDRAPDWLWWWLLAAGVVVLGSELALANRTAL